MIALWILLGILLLLFLLLLVPVRADVTYRDAVTLDVRYLFLKFRILPAPEKPEAGKKPEPEKKQEEKTGEKKPNAAAEKVKRFLKAEGFSGFMQLVGGFLKLTATQAVRLIRKVRLRNFDLYVMTGGENAAEAAILYGRACALVYSAAEALFTLTKCGKRRRRVSVDLDYSVKTPYVQLEASVSIRPLFVLQYGLQYLIGLLPIYQRLQNPRKRGAQGKPDGKPART
ncbi:MAG: hypothetical protein ACI4GO_05365 [Hominenteromicrobium sp.]